VKKAKAANVMHLVALAAAAVASSWSGSVTGPTYISGVASSSMAGFFNDHVSSTSRFSPQYDDVTPHDRFYPNAMFSPKHDDRRDQGHGDDGVAYRGRMGALEFEAGAGIPFNRMSERGEEGAEGEGGEEDKGDVEEDEEEDKEDGVEAADDTEAVGGVDTTDKKKKRTIEGPSGGLLKISALICDSWKTVIN
jgi:hypothetical protein